MWPWVAVLLAIEPSKIDSFQDPPDMAPLKDETVETLRDLVTKLESRVEQLEAKLNVANGGESKSNKPAESIRMILMGPPGAGMLLLLIRLTGRIQATNYVYRKRHTSSKNQGKVLRLSFGLF